MEYLGSIYDDDDDKKLNSEIKEFTSKSCDICVLFSQDISYSRANSSEHDCIGVI